MAKTEFGNTREVTDARHGIRQHWERSSLWQIQKMRISDEK